MSPTKDPCDETEIRRLVEIQTLVDSFTKPGPFLIWDPETGRNTKAELARRIERQASELRQLRDTHAKVVQGLLLLLRKELP